MGPRSRIAMGSDNKVYMLGPCIKPDWIETFKGIV